MVESGLVVRTTRCVVLCLLAAIVVGCAAPAETESSSAVTGVTLKTIAVTPTTTSAFAGATEALTAIGTYSNGTTQDLTATATWTSSNPSVATVSPSGVVT